MITYRRCHVIITGLGVLVVALLLVFDVTSPAGRPVLKISGNDSVGYFGTAHSLLFDFDFNLTNEYAILRPGERYHLMAIQSATGLPGSPWPIGYSLLQVPFLALGTFVDYLVHNPADGYSRYALTFYYLGNVVFMTIGLVCLFQFLYVFTGSELPSVSEPQRLWICLVVALLFWPSTTLGYYTFSPMSHVAGFMAVTLMVRVWWRVKDRNWAWDWVLLGLCGGLTILCRWQNALLLLWPPLYDMLGWRSSALRRSSFNWPWFRARLLFASVAVACLIPQFIQWKVIYGRYVIQPQGSQSLQFPPWFIPNLLFSTRHGWFTWTPVVVVCVIGLLYGCYRAKRVFIPLTTVLFLEVVVVGSLPAAWDAGESFGMRYLTCTLSIPALGFAWLVYHASPRNLVALAIIVAACTLYSIVFAVQYRLDLLPRRDWLTARELVHDKIFLKQAYERERQVRLAKTFLQENRSASAIDVLENAERRYGKSRVLLQVLIQAYRATGREQEAERVQQQLQALLNCRLY
jgi:hypothetical protein